MESITLQQLIEQTIHQYVSSDTHILNIESNPIQAGSQAVELLRHHVEFLVNGLKKDIYLITKKATFIERSALSRLFLQGANVPFSLSNEPHSEDRSLICIQDVDYQTDYSHLDMDLLQNKELRALAYIHGTNMGSKKELPWISAVDRNHIIDMMENRWRPSWTTAIESPAFIEGFGLPILSEIEAVASSIVDDLEVLIRDEHMHTMIHNDLNPGNILVHNNENVYFIDWEEARYGSVFFDIPLRCSHLRQVEIYREALSSYGYDIPQEQFEKYFSLASRYLGIRYMSWNLGVWEQHPHAKDDLIKYMKMVTQPLFS
ncbi:aminoglycoside phosphotransferase family protein [Paenibacillus sp. F6_3S_P_1C]|uniref:Aminoglycoside phosphotransferase family protein n=1 Tax=Paenibacillus vandeheii TaxID=3035917 RepID=A0ABT8J3N8_9BACL|nr:aminoglycoside phosphotransferase family protein [Paenibacillus vandeheii]MDN4599670.1 aminoglycoside phosphotransferase family protein [Paenibacillus vandeheii]